MYKGGGYDGCMWEYNYCFISPDGIFHNIAATGYKGIKTVEDFLEAWEGWKWKREQDRKENRSVRYQSPDYHLYYLGGSQEPDPRESGNVFEEFADAAPISHLLGVARWFREHDYPYTFKPRCDQCEERFDAADGEGEGIHGCGGVAMEYNDVICPDCHSAYSCAYCGEYVGPDDMAKDPENPDDTAESGYCKWCEHTHNGGPDPDARGE